MDHLHRAFDRLSAGITEESPLQSTGLREPFRKRPLVFVVVEIRSVEEQRGLLANHFRDAWMRVSQRVYADAGDHVQIALAIRVVNIGTFPAMQRNRIPGIVL